MASLSARLARAIEDGETAMLVSILGARGSTPREAGAAMLVTAVDMTGTIGGGHLEFHAINVARAMIADGESVRTIELPLGPLFGQCCGGHVTLAIESIGKSGIAGLRTREAHESDARPRILILGAGHTGRALAAALAPLPFAVTLTDDRDGVFEGLPEAVTCHRLDDPEAAITAAPAGISFVILTHSHSLDYRLADAALRRRDAAYVGMIGSATKRSRFERWYRQQGGPERALSAFVCPIGGTAVRDKRPEVIAALVTSELLAIHYANEVRLADPRFAVHGRALGAGMP